MVVFPAYDLLYDGVRILGM